MISECYRRTTSAEAKEFAFGAFLHLLMLAIEFLFFAVEYVINRCCNFFRAVSEESSDRRFEASASHHFTGG
jgi:hypothetical protein